MKELAREVGMASSTLYDLERGDQESTTKLGSIADRLGVRITWLEHGVGRREADFVREAGKPYDPGRHVVVAGESGAQVYVDRISGAHLSAGSGTTIYDLEELPGSRAYDAEWMRSEGMRPQDCKVWQVGGESMAPTVPGGSFVLVHLRSREPRHDRIFALITEDGLRLKRLLRRSDGVWEIHSDNPNKMSYPTEPYVHGKVAILGQVRDISIPMPA